MKQEIEKILYWDPQQEKSDCCERCGSTIYGPGYRCNRCQRDEYDT